MTVPWYIRRGIGIADWPNLHVFFFSVAIDSYSPSMSFAPLHQDLMLELSEKQDAAAYMELGNVSQQLQRRTGQVAEKFSRKWYEKYALSFDVQRVKHSDYRIKLTKDGQKRAESQHEREENTAKTG